MPAFHPQSPPTNHLQESPTNSEPQPALSNHLQVTPASPKPQPALILDSISYHEKKGEKNIPGTAINTQQSKGKTHLVTPVSGPITRRFRGRKSKFSP